MVDEINVIESELVRGWQNKKVETAHLMPEVRKVFYMACLVQRSMNIAQQEMKCTLSSIHSAHLYNFERA